MTAVDAEYEAALSSPTTQLLNEIADQFHRPIGRFGITCDAVTQQSNKKRPPDFAKLSPLDAALVDVLVQTGRFDVALARIQVVRQCQHIIKFAMHPGPSTPKCVEDRVTSTLVSRWRGSPSSRNLVLVIWPKALRLRLLGYSVVDEILQADDGFNTVVNLLGGPKTSDVVQILVSLTDATTDAVKAPRNAKMTLGLRLINITEHLDSTAICVAFLGFLTPADRLGRLVFCALARHGWQQVGHAVVTLLNRCDDQDAQIPGLVRLVLQLVGLEGTTKWFRDARCVQNQEYFVEYARVLYRCALLWATLSKVATSYDDATRTELLVQLLRLEAHVTTYKGAPPKTCLSKVLGDDRVAYMVGLYTTPLVLDYVASLEAHDVLYSPVNIAAPAIVQLKAASTCPATFIEGAISWLTSAGHRATPHGLACLLQVLVAQNCLDKMDALWSEVGVVIPAILELVATTHLSSATLVVFDRAVALSVTGFVPFIPDDAALLAPLRHDLLGRGYENGDLIDVQHRLMVDAAAYLTHDPPRPRMLPPGAVQSLLGLCRSPTAAWLLAPLVFGLPHGIEQRQLAHACIEIFELVRDDDPVIGRNRWREDLQQLRYIRNIYRG